MIRKALDLTYALIGKNKYLARTKPFVDAADSFFYGMPEVTNSAPHIRDNVDIKRYMIAVVVALTPATIASFYFFGWKVLIFYVVSYAFGLGTEAIFAIVRKEEINEGAFVTCFLFPMLLPPSLPWYWCAVGIVVGIVFGKEIFGGTGKNVFNPALVGRCFLFLCFPLMMTDGHYFTQPQVGDQGGLGGTYLTQTIAPNKEQKAEGLKPLEVFKSKDGLTVTGATPLGVWKVKLDVGDKEKTLAYRKEYESHVLPDLYTGRVSGSLGETSVWLLLIPALFLMAMKIANWRTVAACFGSTVLFSLVMSWIVPMRFAGPLFTLGTGGIMLGYLYMATDPVSGPITSRGRWYYGILIGVLTVVIRGVSGYAEGVMFAILLANIFAPTIDYMVISAKYKPKEAAA